MKPFVPKLDDRLICEKCATKSGAVWPEDFAGINCYGECCVCGKQFKLSERTLCHVDDWDWPMSSDKPLDLKPAP